MGAVILSVISERIASVRYLDEFMVIIDKIQSSIPNIRNNIEQIVAAAEAALSAMQDAIALT
jgi:hypothetical protein